MTELVLNFMKMWIESKILLALTFNVGVNNSRGSGKRFL